MTTAYERAKSALDDLIDWADDHRREVGRNEATTRLHLINQLLENVLGWPVEETEAEESHGGEYVDYALGTPFRRAIVEAKREGTHFEVPVGVTAVVQRLTALTEGAAGRPLREACDQVAGYCAARGVPFAIVCNGTQIVAFLATRSDGTPPLNGVALVFSSLSAMRENFRLLWENLSKPGIEARRLLTTLREGEVPTAPPALSARLPRYPGYKRRNDIQVGLEILVELFLEDVTKIEELQEEFLDYCYASSGALSQYAMISKQILESRYSLIHETEGHHEVESAAGKKGVNPQLTADALASAMSERPIILLGDVGVGKTMFIRRLIHVDAKEVFQDTFTLYIDFGRRPALVEELSQFVADEVARQFLSEYGIDLYARDFVEAVHHGQLNRFDKGVYGELKDVDEVGYRRERVAFLNRLIENPNSHLAACFEHIRGSMHRQIVLFLDNIDQRPYEFQEQVFLIGESMASSWPATVFVSLRPETFYRSRSEGSLSAYQPRVFTIGPPRTDVVLKRRLEFALQQLQETSRLSLFPEGVSMESESLVAFVEVLIDNFESNTKLLEMIENLASGNTRRALDFVSAFVGSGHVDTRKILRIAEESGRYTISLHEFLRSIIFGDYEYFDPETSPVGNLFDISQPDGREHFLLGLLISKIERQGDEAGTDGFVSADAIYAYAQKNGFSADQTAWALERATKNGMLERAPRSGKRGGEEYLRVTSAGVYTARVLASIFAYVDAVLVDTPVVDDAFGRSITDAHTLAERVRRVEVFRAYLDKQWLGLEPALAEPGVGFDWREHSDRLRTEIGRVESHIPTD